MSITTERAIKRLSIHLRADVDCYNQAVAKGYMNAALVHKTDAEANRIAITALREKAEREDPKPLTLEELRQMDREPVWVVELDDKAHGEYCVIQIGEPLPYQDIDHYNSALIPGIEHDWYSFGDYGKTWIAYRHKPKEVTK